MCRMAGRRPIGERRGPPAFRPPLSTVGGRLGYIYRMVKFVIFFLLPLALILWLFLFPSTIRRALRRPRRGGGDFGRAGQELMTGAEVKGSPLARYEAQAGRAVEEKILAAHPISADENLQGRAAFVGARVAACALRREIVYRFRVIEAPEPAAF